MKEKELREAAKCRVCGKLLGQTSVPLFYRVTIERFGLDLNAIDRQQGLTMMLGGSAVLAGVMGTNDEMAVSIMDPVNVTVCEDCSTKDVLIAELAEESDS